MVIFTPAPEAAATDALIVTTVPASGLSDACWQKYKYLNIYTCVCVCVCVCVCERSWMCVYV